MTLTDALDRLAVHLTDAQEKHEPIRDRGDALNRINAYMTKANGEHNSGEDVDKDARFAKRIAQAAAVCMRTLIDLNISDHDHDARCATCGK